MFDCLLTCYTSIICSKLKARITSNWYRYWLLANFQIISIANFILIYELIFFALLSIEGINFDKSWKTDAFCPSFVPWVIQLVQKPSRKKNPLSSHLTHSSLPLRWNPGRRIELISGWVWVRICSKFVSGLTNRPHIRVGMGDTNKSHIHCFGSLSISNILVFLN